VLRRLVHDESGFALVLALMTVVVLAILATTAIFYTTQSQHQSSYSKASDAAYRLAETGINNAMATLGYSAVGNPSQTNALNSSALPNTEAAASSFTYTSGTAKWWGTLTGMTWTIYGKGLVASPIANSSQVTRQVSASMLVTLSASQPLNTAAWNFMYLSDPVDPANPTKCNTTIDGSGGSPTTRLDAPLYVEGNLCLKGSAQVVEDALTPPLHITVTVKGSVTFDKNTSIGVGSPLAQVTAVSIAGTCISDSLKTAHTCNPSSPTNDPIYVAGGLTPVKPVAAPDVATDWSPAGWYANASPGPAHPCTTITGTPPLFDGGPAPNNVQQDISGLYPNGSLQGVANANPQNLTPAASYTCKTSRGELSWDAPSHTMTVSGVVYIDGSVRIGEPGGIIDEYNGPVVNGHATIAQAALWTSGGVTFAGTMCAVKNVGGTACDFQNWNPNTEMWIIAAHGVGASGSGSTNSIGMSGGSSSNPTQWQGGLWGTQTINLSGWSFIEGPAIGGSAAISGQAVARPFPLITSLPLGTPGNPNTYAQPNPPGNFSG